MLSWQLILLVVVFFFPAATLASSSDEESPCCSVCPHGSSLSAEIKEREVLDPLISLKEDGSYTKRYITCEDLVHKIATTGPYTNKEMMLHKGYVRSLCGDCVPSLSSVPIPTARSHDDDYGVDSIIAGQEKNTKDKNSTEVVRKLEEDSQPSPTTKVFLITCANIERNFSLFCDGIFQGCVEEANRRNEKAGYKQVVCEYGQTWQLEDHEGNTTEDYYNAIFESLALNASIDGVATYGWFDDALQPSIDKVVDAGIPVVTFFEDSPKSKRQSFISLNGWEMGRLLARLLNRLRPEGGEYGLLSLEQMPNQAEAALGFRAYMEQEGTNWFEAPTSPKGMHLQNLEEFINATTFVSAHEWVDFMQAYADEGVDAIAVTNYYPFESGGSYIDFRLSNTNITVVGEATDYRHLDLLLKEKVDAFVEYSSVQLGVKIVDHLWNHSVGEGKSVPEVTKAGTMAEMIRVPVILPELTVDENYLGKNRIYGYVLFAILAGSSILCTIWTWHKRNVSVVKVSQPSFLIMISTGIFIMSGSLISASHEVIPADNSQSMDAACIATPWLLTIGGSITFSALFARSWRINKMFRSTKPAHARFVVKERDVLPPFFVLFGINVAIMTAWTVLNPLEYKRLDHPSKDPWDRTLSTYGTCTSEHSVWPYLAPLLVVNVAMMIVATWQIYAARSVQSKFGELQDIATAMVNLLQTTLSVVPMLFLLKDEPLLYYFGLSTFVFAISMVILLLIFMPKIATEAHFSSMTPEQQAQAMRRAVQSSIEAAQQKSASGSLHPKQRRWAQIQFSPTTGKSGNTPFSAAGSSITSLPNAWDLPKAAVSPDQQCGGERSTTSMIEESELGSTHINNPGGEDEPPKALASGQGGCLNSETRGLDNIINDAEATFHEA